MMKSPFFENYGIVSGGFLNVSPREALELCAQGAILIDVREDYLNAFKKFAVEHILYIPMSELAQRLAELPPDKPLIIADAAGIRSKEAVKYLSENNYFHIANLAGGMIEWERDGIKLIEDVEERLTGSCMCQLKPREKKKA